MTQTINPNQLTDFPFEDDLQFGRNWIIDNFYTDSINARERQYRKVWQKAFESLAMSSISWHGVPVAIDRRAIEYILLHFGMGALFMDEGGHLFAQSSFADQINMYYNPNEVMLTSPAGQWWYRHAQGWIKDGEYMPADCAICWDNMERIPLIYKIRQYAQRIARYDYIQDMNIDAQLTPWVIAGKPEGPKQLIKMQKKLERRDQFWPVTDLGLDELPIVMPTGAPFVADKIAQVKQVLINECLTLIGYDNTNIDKKERVQTAEVLSNNEMIMGLRESRLKARQQFVERANVLFGLDMSVEWGIEGSFADIASVMKGGGFHALNMIQGGVDNGNAL